MFERAARRTGDEIDGARQERQLMGRPTGSGRSRRRRCASIRPEPHSTGGSEGDANHDAVLWRIAMPSNRRTGWIPLISAMAIASSSIPAHMAARVRSALRKSGKGARVCPDDRRPARRTRRVAEPRPHASRSRRTPRPRHCSTRRASSAGVRKSRSYWPPSGSSSSNSEGPGLFMSFTSDAKHAAHNGRCCRVSK